MRGPDELVALAQDLVRRAKTAGADHAEAFLHEGRTLSVSCKGEIVTPKEAHSIGMSVRVAIGGRIGLAGSSGVHGADVIVREALASARAAPTSPGFQGFARPVSNPRRPAPVHPVIAAADAARLEDLARAALDGLDSSETTFRAVSLSSGRSTFAVANDQGVAAWDRAGRENLHIENRTARGARSVTAWDGATALGPIEQAVDPAEFAREATRRARDALDARPLERPVDEVILDPSPVGQIVGRLVESFSGNLVRAKQSPLGGRLGENVADRRFTLTDVPYGDDVGQRLIVDHEGVPTAPHDLIRDGHLSGFLYDTLTGDAEGCGSTGNGLRANAWSGGVGIRPIHPTVAPGRGTMEDLIAETDRAVLVTDALAGMFTTNATTGDFSATVPYAFLIERGEIRHALPNTTLGGNLLHLLGSIKSIGGHPAEQRTGTAPPIHFGGVSCAN